MAKNLHAAYEKAERQLAAVKQTHEAFKLIIRTLTEAKAAPRVLAKLKALRKSYRGAENHAYRMHDEALRAKYDVTAPNRRQLREDAYESLKR